MDFSGRFVGVLSNGLLKLFCTPSTIGFLNPFCVGVPPKKAQTKNAPYFSIAEFFSLWTGRTSNFAFYSQTTAYKKRSSLFSQPEAVPARFSKAKCLY
jgi:hypothetical protein